MGHDAEQFDVSLTELKSGIKLRAGHKVVLIVGGAAGSKRGAAGDPGEDAVVPLRGEGADEAGPSDPGSSGPGPSQPVPSAGGEGPGPDAVARPAAPDSAPSAAPDSTPEAPAAPAPVAHDALDVQIVSAAGAPQKQVEYEVTLPDGTRRAGRTDGEGRIRIDGLPKRAGCKLLLPDMKAAADAGQPTAGRGRYQPEMPVQAGQATVVELAPRVHRGQLTGMHFETAKTFLLPSAMAGIRQLCAIYQSYGAELAVLVSGHTDTQGAAAYNRTLSNERADSIGRFITDDVDGWMKFYSGQAGSDPWGVREDQYMLSTLADASGPYYAAKVDGQLGPKTQAAYKKFQTAKGLPVTGTPNVKTRQALVTDYMAQDGTSLPKGAKLAFHGCGFSHLAVPTGPNVAEPANRRVEIFLFEGEVQPAPQATCPAGGCAEYPQWVAKTQSTVDLDQPAGSVSIKVTDAKGAPLADVDVHLSGQVALDGKTGPDGTTSFPQVIPGTYKTIASKPGFSAADADVDVAPGAAASAALSLQGVDASLTILVMDEATPAAPIKDAQVTIDRPGVAPVTTGKDGRAFFDKLAAGKVKVKAAFRGVEKNVDFEVGAQDQTKAKSGGTKLGLVGDAASDAGDSGAPAANVVQLAVAKYTIVTDPKIERAVPTEYEVSMTLQDGSMFVDFIFENEESQVPAGEITHIRQRAINRPGVWSPCLVFEPGKKTPLALPLTLSPDKPTQIEARTRLRLSVFGFNKSLEWLKESFDGKEWKLNEKRLQGMQDAHLDDFTLIPVLSLDPNSLDDANGPRPLLMPAFTKPPPVYIKFLQQLGQALKDHKIEFCPGFTVVVSTESQIKDPNELTPEAKAKRDKSRTALAAALSDPARAEKLAVNIVNFFVDNQIPFDGINYDFELDGLSLKHYKGIEALFVKTAELMAARGGWVAYENLPRGVDPDPENGDGGGQHGDQAIQPFKLAAKAPARNLIARPMLETGSGDLMDKSIKCALGKGPAKGNLHPSQLQFAVWGPDKHTGALRAADVGFVLPALSESFVDQLKEAEKALNAGPQPAPQASAVPLQGPRK